MSEILSFDRVTKTYADSTAGAIEALHPTSFTLPAGRTVAVVGRSGSGKSTLLHLAAGIDLPTSGTVRLRGHDLSAQTDGERTRLRRDLIGFVFQFFHLLPHLSVRDNVALPAMIAGGVRRDDRARADELLAQVGLGARGGDQIHQLSGGEMQRVAICRALLRRPTLLLADEPTGNLDDDTGRDVMDLMLTLSREQGATLVFVTHSRELAARADETWELHSGALLRP